MDRGHQRAPAASTTFPDLLFPPARRPRKITEPNHGTDLRGGTETILVVEDETAVREVVTEILHSHGYVVLQAVDGPDALEVWSQHRSSIDLVVTDIVMPNGLRGNVLADRLLEDKADLKIIFSSGYSEDFATVDQPSERKITFLQKPYRLEELVQKVRVCLDRD